MLTYTLQGILPGFPGLFSKECKRYFSVSIQTIFGPVFASLLFLFVFAHVFTDRAMLGDVKYGSFLLPGLAGMTMLQQAFANPSSSLIVSKITGNIVMILLSPISPLSFFLAHLLASLTRGVLVASLVLICGLWFVDFQIVHPGWALIFLLAGGVMTSALGIMAGIWADKFDQIAMVQTVLLLPLTFLAGVFYSLQSLPQFWQFMSKLNPFLYFIDGFRYGFLGISDHPIWFSFTITLMCALIPCIVSYWMIVTGYKLRN